MKNAKWSHLIGMSGTPLRWERPLLFFAALSAGDLVWLLIGPSVSSGPTGEGSSLELWNIPAPWTWLLVLLPNLVLAALVTVSFAVIRNVFAVAPLAILYGLSSTVLQYLFSVVEGFGGPAPFWDKYRTFSLVTNVVWALFFFSLVETAMRVIKPLLVALLAGSIATSLLLAAVNPLLGSLVLEEQSGLSRRLLFLPFTILSGVLVSVTLWAGVRLTSGSSPIDDTRIGPRVSKGFYLGTLAVTNGLALFVSFAVIILIVTETWRVRELDDITPIFLLLGLTMLIVLYGAIAFCVLIHRMWSAIQDGRARTSPGWAVGGMFIPFYNLYWIFQVFPGFAEDFNAFADRQGIDTRLSRGVFKSYAIFSILAAIPYLGFPLVLVAYVLQLVMVGRICDALNALPLVHTNGGAELSANSPQP